MCAAVGDVYCEVDCEERMIMKTMEYEGYVGSVEFSEMDNVFYGKVQNVSGLISYEGKTKEELFLDFCSSIEDYLGYLAS